MGSKQRLRHSAGRQFQDPTGPAGSAAGWVIRRLVRQGHHPTGPAGRATGWMMGLRSSNVRRNRWAVDLLAVEPTDRVLELGCGPGVAIAALAGRATQGLVVGVDHSQVMIRQARRRNAAAVRAGRVRLIQAPVERLQLTDGPFDAALAVNTVGMWSEPTARLRDIGGLLRPGGRIALVSQPRCPGATAATSAAAGDELAGRLSDAGFENPRIETLDLDPPAVCVLATRPRGD
jgi:SAM-dependent methyltransferase